MTTFRPDDIPVEQPVKRKRLRWFHKQLLKYWRHEPKSWRSIRSMRRMLVDGEYLDASDQVFHIVDQLRCWGYLEVKYFEVSNRAKEGWNIYRPTAAGRRWLARRAPLFLFFDLVYWLFGRVQYPPRHLGKGWL